MNMKIMYHWMHKELPTKEEQIRFDIDVFMAALKKYTGWLCVCAYNRGRLGKIGLEVLTLCYPANADMRLMHAGPREIAVQYWDRFSVTDRQPSAGVARLRYARLGEENLGERTFCDNVFLLLAPRNGLYDSFVKAQRRMACWRHKNIDADGKDIERAFLRDFRFVMSTVHDGAGISLTTLGEESDPSMFELLGKFGLKVNETDTYEVGNRIARRVRETQLP